RPQTGSGGCPNHGWFKDWYAVGKGGWNGDGCTGRMIAVPMSGDADRDDPDNVVVWWFRPPAAAARARGVPPPGAPASSLVCGSTAATGTPIGQFTVDQVHNQGRWVAVGTFRAAAGGLAV